MHLFAFYDNIILTARENVQKICKVKEVVIIKQIKKIIKYITIVILLDILLLGLITLYQLRVKQTINDKSNHAIQILGN